MALMRDEPFVVKEIRRLLELQPNVDEEFEINGIDGRFVCEINDDEHTFEPCANCELNGTFACGIIKCDPCARTDGLGVRFRKAVR